MSEQPDAVTPLYGAPAVEEDHAITVTAPWHTAGPTGAVESPPVEEVRNYEVSDDGKTATAKVLTPPAKPTRKSGRQAEAKVVDEVQAEQDPEA